MNKKVSLLFKNSLNTQILYYCPNPNCIKSIHNFPGTSISKIKYKKDFENSLWFTYGGSFIRKRDNKTIVRYKCKCCNKSFSNETFKLSYYDKKNINYKNIFKLSVSNISNTRIAELTNRSSQSISRIQMKIAKQFMWLNNKLLNNFQLKENLVADGFQTFTNSQYFPHDINIIVGKKSQFLYSFDNYFMRKHGKMTTEQKEIRSNIDKYAKYEYKACYNSFTNMLLSLCRIGFFNNDFILFTDEKHEYTDAIKNLEKKGLKVRHVKISSKKHRGLNNELFSVNYIDREFRKNIANHNRETKCHSKEINMSLYRICLHHMYINYFKDYRKGQKQYKGIKHYQVAGFGKKEVIEKLKKIFTYRNNNYNTSLNTLNYFYKILWNGNVMHPVFKNKYKKPKYEIINFT